MRVVYVVSKWNQPTETFVRREAAAACDAGATVQVLSLKRPGTSDGIVLDSSVDVMFPSVGAAILGVFRQLRRRPRKSLEAFARIVSLGRRGTWLPHLRAAAAALAVVEAVDDADVILAHFAWVSSTAADVLSQLTGRPFAVFVHAHAIYEDRCQDEYLGDRLRRACRVFVESPSIAADVRSRFNVEPVVMRVGVPRAYVVRYRRGRGLTGHVLSVGALRGKKGHDVLIRAVSQLPNAHLRIAGEGPDRADLQRLIVQLGLEDRVVLLGHRELDEITRLLDDAAVFCLASRVTPTGDRDGVPNVLIEAMARGVPVVASAVSGIPDLLADRCGVTVPPEDDVQLANAIRDLLDDESAAAAIAEAATARVVSDYTVESNWRILESHLMRCAASSS